MGEGPSEKGEKIKDISQSPLSLPTVKFPTKTGLGNGKKESGSPMRVLLRQSFPIHRSSSFLPDFLYWLQTFNFAVRYLIHFELISVQDKT